MTIQRFFTALTVSLAALLGAACATAAPRLKDHVGRYDLEVLADGRRLPTFRRKGQSYLLGKHGRRYTLRLHNRSNRRVEAVVTVDGRDVLDGKTGHWRKRGYLIPAWGSIEIDGWRLSSSSVAAFRFASVADSYAAKMGSARSVGVIGVAIFRERWVAPPRPAYVPRPLEERMAPHARAPSSADSAEAESAAAPRRSYKGRGGEGSYAKRSRRRPGLGTAFGERRTSHVEQVSFARAHATQPSALLGLRYNDRRGLIAMGVDVEPWRRHRREADRRHNASPFPAEPTSWSTPPPGWQD